MCPCVNTWYVCVHSCVSVCGSAKCPPDVDSSQGPEQCLT